MNNHSKCQEYREAITALVLGELDTDTSTEVHQHLKNCPNCQNFRDALEKQELAIISAFDTVKLNTDPLESEILHKLQQQPAQPRTKRVRSWRIWAFRAAVAAVVLLAVGLRLTPFICLMATVLATSGKGF
jgi:anti-sigma factor RsiW